MLARHDGQIAVVSVVGPYHSGKSFLLNALVGETGIFQIGRRTSPETMGIWMCRTNLRAKDGSEVFLMDSEGFFGPGVSESYDAKIFTIATLLGGHVVYNTVKIIDQQAVSLLEMLARRAQLFRTRSAAEPASLEAPEFLSVRNFPPLTWVVEDFVQELPEEHRDDEDGATAWLKSYLSKANGSSDALALGHEDGDPHLLSRLYSGVKVHTLFLPATEKQSLQDLSKLRWDELTADFKDEVSTLRNHILRNLEARQFEGKAMRGPTLDRALRFITQALQRGMFAEMPSLWATWTQQVAQMSLQDAETWFTSLLTHIDSQDDPVPVADFNREVEDSREKAVAFYTELLRDFELDPDVRALRDRLAHHFQSKLTLYHERVQRWVSQLIERAKEGVSRRLANVELPVDPVLLQSQGENATQAEIRVFADRLLIFSQKGAPVTLGKVAQMPQFTQDPTIQLSNDLRTILSARELENEREIAHIFKAAVAAADEAVESELKASTSKLLGRTRMKELQALVATRCWEAFDEKLMKHRWMMLLTHYRTHKALVQTDAYDGKIARFIAINEQKLSAHFRTAFDRCANSYKARKVNLAMPASETELEAEHRQLASSMREILDEQAGNTGDLKDTDAYRGAVMSLNAVLEEGLVYLRQKNIELWKVHSDEATRCAVRLNDAVMRQCGLIPLCLFNKIPQVHKSTSKKHLIQCFPQSGAGARMSLTMQASVFENWYSKDLSHDASQVWTNFYIYTALIGLCVLVLCLGGRLCSSPPPPPLQQSYGQGNFGGSGGNFMPNAGRRF